MGQIIRRMMRRSVEREKRWESITSRQVTMLVGAVNEVISNAGYKGKIHPRAITIFTKNGEAFSVGINSTVHPDVVKLLPTTFEGHEVIYDRYAEYRDYDNTPQFFIEAYRVDFFEDHTHQSNSHERYLLVHDRDTGLTFKVKMSELNTADRKLLDERFPEGPQILR